MRHRVFDAFYYLSWNGLLYNCYVWWLCYFSKSSIGLLLRRSKKGFSWRPLWIAWLGNCSRSALEIRDKSANWQTLPSTNFLKLQGAQNNSSVNIKEKKKLEPKSKKTLIYDYIIIYYHLELYISLGWKRLVRTSSPAINTTLPSPRLNHDPNWHIYTYFGDSTTSLISLFSRVNTLSIKKFPNIWLKAPMIKLETIISFVTSCLGEETKTHTATTSFQGVQEGNKVSPQIIFLQSKLPHSPQLLLIIPPDSSTALLSSLQHLSVFLAIWAHSGWCSACWSSSQTCFSSSKHWDALDCHPCLRQRQRMH